METDHALTADGLRKRYGDLHALDGFDLSVPAGIIHGLLGPNGAGKTTAVKALATLIDLDGGRRRGRRLRRHAPRPGRSAQRIGLVGQNAAVDEILGGRQNLVMFGRLFGLTTADARARADELLDTFGLTEAAGPGRCPPTAAGCAAGSTSPPDLILTPAVLFLDEPTTGLDPRARNEVWAERPGGRRRGAPRCC